MAITRAQQVKQMLQNGGRIGLRKGSIDRGFQAPSSAGQSPRGSSFGGGADASKTDFGPPEKVRRGGGADSIKVSPSYGKDQYEGTTQAGGTEFVTNLVPGTNIPDKDQQKKLKKTLRDKNKDKFLIPSILNREFMFNLAQKLPLFGAPTIKERQKAYKEFLESKGVTNIPASLDSENAFDFFESGAFNYEPKVRGQPQATIQNYGDFALENFGTPGIKFSGDVGNKEVFVKGYREDGSKIYGVREKTGGRDDKILFTQGTTPTDPVDPTDPNQTTDVFAGIAPAFAGSIFDFDKLRRQLEEQSAADGGRIGAQEGGIMPRLNQLGSGVSSAEQTLQDINQRLESAESSLGEGGATPAVVDDNRFRDPVTGGGQPFFGNMGFNFRQPGDMGRYIADNDPGGIMAGYSSYQDYLNAGNDPVSRPQGPQPLLSAQGVLGIPASGYADGGRIGADEGGIMDLETGRQMYFLGKLVKKAKRAVKKIAKSPIGKAALMFGIPGTGFGGLFGRASLGGAAKGLFGKYGIAQTLGMQGLSDGAMGGKKAGLGGLFERVLGFAKDNPILTGGLTLGGLSLFGNKQKQEELDEGPELTMEELLAIRANPFGTIMPSAAGSKFEFAADGGRIGYQEGSKEPVAKKTMPLLDMGGKEMDLRDDGGFVPIGRMEKADDVPARLSKNEFVFTADAVRNAGEGDVDKGAEVMYNMMKNLESGGQVSEESQGLQGARDMFQTSKRLEEVL